VILTNISHLAYITLLDEIKGVILLRVDCTSLRGGVHVDWPVAGLFVDDLETARVAT
jgi:hypothetical protein